MLQSDLHWTASDGYSTSNSATPQQDVTMEEDQRLVTPASQWQHQLLPRSSGMSNSSSAPDLRLMLTTEIPHSRPMFLPNSGSYAGAMVPYKGPEVRRYCVMSVQHCYRVEQQQCNVKIMQGDMMF